MTTFVEKMKYYSILMAIMGIIAMCVFLFTIWKTYALGYAVGLLCGYLSLWTIYIKTIAIGQVVRKTTLLSAIAQIGANAGFLIRILLAIVPVWIAITYPQQLDLLYTIFGFCTLFIIIFIDTICQFMKRKG